MVYRICTQNSKMVYLYFNITIIILIKTPKMKYALKVYKCIFFMQIALRILRNDLEHKSNVKCINKLKNRPMLKMYLYKIINNKKVVLNLS